MYTVFRGYQKWDSKLHMWVEDEWLVDIYGDLRSAREAVEIWGEGRPFDNNRELQITRYWKKRSNPFTPGEETEEGDPALREKSWMRYDEFEIRERSLDEL